MTKQTQPTLTDHADNLSNKLEGFFVGSLPALPDNIKEFIVKASPYLTLIMMLLLLPVIVAGLGLGAIITPFSFLGGIGSGFSFILGMVFAFGSLILSLMALPGLFKREKRSWKLVYYSNLLSLFNNLFTGGLGSMLFSALFSFYFLFQVKGK
ncbi:hypothetical protein DYH11_02175, partial [Candidatus Microgenomates bacterium CPR3]|nr:hypothetical protein [Candidatus Microgenomates bacterium CPR3]